MSTAVRPLVNREEGFLNEIEFNGGLIALRFEISGYNIFNFAPNLKQITLYAYATVQLLLLLNFFFLLIFKPLNKNENFNFGMG